MILVPSLLVMLAATTVEAKRAAGAAPIIDVDPDVWVQECATVFQETCCRSGTDSQSGTDPYFVNYSSYDVLKKPSGLCKPEFSCAYDKCLPKKYQTPIGNITGNIDTFVADFLSGINITTNTTYADVELILGPGLNLPRQMVFPTKPQDVIEAIQHAKDEGLTVSIMATGHSYTGASTSAQSVQLNLREYPKYSTTEGVVECTTADDTTVVVAMKEENQAACKLALARGKKALLRVGGGETSNDVATSVWAYKDNDNNTTTFAKYMMLHGVGTVGAAGGWLQGGGLGWGQERIWGLGVDQVLEIEMILADGTHVKFYPVQWEDDEGFKYPRTTKVEGVCNTNTEEEESDWVWEACSDRIAFEDLWFAVRGGGGGTYGVVLSVKVQLHESVPMYYFTTNRSVSAENAKALGDANMTADELKTFDGVYENCQMDSFFNFLFNPTQVNVSRDDSNACGSPSFVILDPRLICLGESASTALKSFYDKSFAECLDTNAPGYQEYGLDIDNAMKLTGPFEDGLLGQFNTDAGTGKNVPGQLTDDGPSILPQARPWSGWCSAQVPHSFLAAGRENEIIENLLTETFVVKSVTGGHTTGGDVSVAHDQMNAVPITERQSGFSSTNLSGLSTDLQEQLLKVFLNETIAKGENFPGITEFNHICSDSHGPLKSDMTKPCNLEYSEDEKDKLCYSMQESVWGIEGTKKLEKIKDAVDPDGLFYCYGCIQSSKKGQPSSPPSSVTTVPPKIPMVDGSTESSSSLKSRYDFTIVSFAVFVVIVAGSW